MARYILRRGLMGLLTAWAVTVLAYVIIQLPPGDYISSYLAQLEASGTFAGEEEAVHLRELYGLDLRDSSFRALRKLWRHDVEAQPLVALTSSLTRDPALRDGRRRSPRLRSWSGGWGRAS